MNNLYSKETIERLRCQFPSGSRIELVRMIDPYSKLKPGDRGTVEYIDDIGTVFCSWDQGSRLGVVFGEDEIVLIKEPMMTETIKEQILAIRNSGVTNMLDANRVQIEANTRRFHDLVIFIEENRKAYLHFIFFGDAR